jgi:sulfur carrier protein ThiS
MKMKILLIFHGSLKKYNDNCNATEMDVPQGTIVGQLIANSGVPNEEIAFAAVNGSRAPVSQALQEGDEVKLFQLVGGG